MYREGVDIGWIGIDSWKWVRDWKRECWDCMDHECDWVW